MPLEEVKWSGTIVISELGYIIVATVWSLVWGHGESVKRGGGELRAIIGSLERLMLVPRLSVAVTMGLE